jgi:opacity protein-like surface antigen
MSRWFARATLAAFSICVLGIVFGTNAALAAKPVEYVKVCSLYGAGFYYVPGTDTCIKIGDYVRNDYAAIQQGEGKICNGKYFTSGSEECTRKPQGNVQYVKICSLYGAGFYYVPGTDICLKEGSWVRDTGGSSTSSYWPRPWFGKRPVTYSGGYNWSGFYVGGELGPNWTYGNWTTTDLVTLSSRDALVNAFKDMRATNIAEDVYWGFLWFLDDDWLAGVAADIAYYYAFMDPSIPGTGGLAGSNGGDSVSVRAKWSASLRARLGYLVTRSTQIYVAAGPSWLNMNATLNCTSSGVCGANPITPFSQTNSTTKAGWTLGGGVESMLWGNWRGHVEYRYSNYGTYSTSFGAPSQLALAADIKVRTQSLMFGLTYGFGSR